MLPARVPFDVDDLRRLPPGLPAELVRGHLVRLPAVPPEVGALRARLAGLVERAGGAFRAAPAPVDVVLGRNDVLRPDLAVLRAGAGPFGGESRAEGALPVAVFEVVLPETRRLDADVKRKTYLRGGVEEVWLLDPETGGVEVHARAGVQGSAGSEPLGSSVVPGLVLVPARLFAALPPSPPDPDSEPDPDDGAAAVAASAV